MTAMNFVSHLQPARFLSWEFAAYYLDLSDIQWRLFREGIGQLAAAMLVFVMLSGMVSLMPGRHTSKCIACTVFAFCRVFAWSASHASFGIVNYQFWYNMFQLFLDCCSPWVIWTFNCVSLMAARLLEGCSFGAISQRLAFLDAYQGPMRWHISYNLVILRQISFAMDKHWAGQLKTDSSQDAVRRDAVNSLKVRQSLPLQSGAYNLATYLEYLFYPPLYIAGPITTFNSFVSQLQQPMPLHLMQLALYAVRLAGAFLLMEVLTHTLYFNSIAKHKLWQRFASELNLGAVHVGMTGFWVLMFVWLKFLIIWRFFRLWAWADGMHTYENMLRCICNNYDIEGFWKGWHASYNQWLVRYMYIPLGGASTRLFNVWVIFTFVALWHDLEWRLLGWAWLMCFFFLPEMAVKWACRQPRFAALQSKWDLRHLAAAAGCCNIIALMTANLVGFVVGLDGIKAVLIGCLSDIWFLAGTVVVCYSAVQIMFEIRRCEHRTSIAGKSAHKPVLAGTAITAYSTSQELTRLGCNEMD